MGSIEDRARVIADGVLFPAALQVDADDVIPSSHFASLAEEGFYGLAARAEDGGAGVDVLPMAGIIETLTGGCLATTFTWMQHHGVVRGLATTANDQLRGKYLDAAISGEQRAGVAYAGAIPQPPRLWATATGGGWLLNGEAPLVSGWGIIDLLVISARDTSPGDDSGLIINMLADASAGGLDGIAVTELQLIAAQASNTVRLHFEDYFVAVEQVISEISHQDFLAHQHIGARLNGSLALGIAGRCIRLISEAGEAATAARLTAEQDAIRRRLDDGLGNPDTLPVARAVASELAYRAAGALVVTKGSSGIMAGSHAERLVREATFTLVAAGRPEIKKSLLESIPRIVS